MTRLTGKAAEEFMKAIRERNEKTRADLLARAKESAATSGKEPFDLAKLEALCDTSAEGRVDPVESRQERYEYMYYVQNPDLMTLKDLAELITHLSQW